jgi:hypothetical protein
MNGSAKDSRVKILVAAFDFQEKVANSSQAISDARLLFAQPIVIGDANIIHVLQKFRFGTSKQEIIQALRAGFLHS